MKLLLIKQRNQAFTWIEALVVIAVLAILAAVLLPVIAAAKRIPQKINCFSNLKQINLAFRIWEGDNNNLYPMAVSTSVGGGKEFILSGDVAGCLRAVSNELSTTKLLVCPGDSSRTFASNWNVLNNSQISYFIGVDVTNETHAKMFFAGDDNLSLNGSPVKSGLLSLATNAPLVWADGRHVDRNSSFWTPAERRYIGHVGFADGSVEEDFGFGLRQALQNTSVITNRLAIP